MKYEQTTRAAFLEFGAAWCRFMLAVCGHWPFRRFARHWEKRLDELTVLILEEFGIEVTVNRNEIIRRFKLPASVEGIKSTPAELEEIRRCEEYLNEILARGLAEHLRDKTSNSVDINPNPEE